LYRAVSSGYPFSKPYADFVARLRVPMGFVLVAAFAWFAYPTVRALACGIPISIAGLALRAWAAGHLAKNQQLATGGPYAYIRNPLYAGTLLVALGLAIAARSVWLAALFAVVFLLVYLPAVMLEEQHLTKLFPEYAGYAALVPSLIPRRKPDPGGSHFRWSLYEKNREYQALLGFAAGLAWLIFRAIRFAP
jgi:protein-S-isoprenylcysteine O-methyltransferase Ste14